MRQTSLVYKSNMILHNTFTYAVNKKDCTSCPYYQFANNKSICHTESSELEDCLIAIKELNLYP